MDSQPSIPNTIIHKMEHFQPWEHFCSAEDIIASGKPLFGTMENLQVTTHMYGSRSVLCRTPEVDQYFATTARTLRKDFEDQTGLYDGILYMMYRIEKDRPIPLYIGKTEKIGKKKKLSSLLKGPAPKPRWDDGPDYHIGGLSTCVCAGYENIPKKNYGKWAKALFSNPPSPTPQLNYPVYLWLRLWKTGETGLWTEFGPTPLCLQEILLINLAYRLFPRDVLNTEGLLR